ncbi:amylo-alpha-1,6-glucosidase [Paenibacillus antri]|uniref:Amylo-alpha-1,6-glucosidase n=1 Tax=Paenibacillus antri TaxID=2582848 RepID=A0A5R9G4P7_9BACL|nr:amylo-alpha-1,6-glucosidase [Paenibacillus antri]TLS49110.1 amylo-alpha-1,6-glucosidase [Paenibacillus antri]
MNGQQAIKEGPLFYVSDERGDLVPDTEQGHGLYWKDTRFLSRLQLSVDRERPALLGTDTSKSYVLSRTLMKETKDRGAIEIRRESFLYEGVFYERLAVTNYYLENNQVELSFLLDADFQDMFLVRKYRTGEVGHALEPFVERRSVALRYLGKDDLHRRTTLAWDDESAAVTESGKRVSFSFELEPRQTKSIHLYAIPAIGEQAAPSLYSFDEALQKLDASYAQWSASNSAAASSNDRFDRLFRRSLQDLRMLQDDIGHGAIPVAGLPWFATPFGRDSLITSLFMLPLHPSHAVGTLRTLAAYQGAKHDPWRDEEPGKIMHEIRFGELANTNQSPFSPYYGGVDSTPLFLILLVEYVRWTGDTSIVTELQASIDAALRWIDAHSASSESRFLTYRQEASEGFPNQGWKDSANSIVHRNGRYAASPIALAEVQGYVYAAKRGLSGIYEAMGDAERAGRLKSEAVRLREQFERCFWMEEEGFYCIALDQNGNQVRSLTSNPGHLLLTGILDASRAQAVARRLLEEDMFSGYGIRTMSTSSTGYYPMSYHNGSVWPHDNGMIVLGMARQGRSAEAMRVVSGLLQAARQFPGDRLPELFCGYDASASDGVVPYPTTCSPQAWSGATAFVMVQAMLGLDPDALAGTLRLRPVLPPELDELTVHNVTVGRGTISVRLARDAEDPAAIHADILSNTTGLTTEIFSPS